jgi:hypothetical protein
MTAASTVEELQALGVRAFDLMIRGLDGNDGERGC